MFFFYVILNSMTCRKCKYEFHWQTLEKWKGYQHKYNTSKKNHRKEADEEF